jgi:hypothetical protein
MTEKRSSSARLSGPTNIAVTRINAEPEAGNRELIWTFRDQPVSGAIRAAVEAALIQHGPLPASALVRILGIPDPLPALCALACQGIIGLDLSHKLNERTRVERLARDINSPA